MHLKCEPKVTVDPPNIHMGQDIKLVLSAAVLRRLTVYPHQYNVGLDKNRVAFYQQWLQVPKIVNFRLTIH